jgi:hypothetical protein
MRRTIEGGNGSRAASILVFACFVGLGCTTSSTPGDGGVGGAPSDGGIQNDGSTPLEDGGPPGGNRDAMSGPIVRTLVYHELSAGENGGVDTTKGIAFSRDGSRGLFDENVSNNYQPTAIGWDGSKQIIDSVSAGWIDMTTVSGDGAWVAYTADALLVSSVASPKRITGPAISQGRSWSRFAKDPADSTKWRLYFMVDTAWGTPSHERGVYSAATDGSGVIELMSPAKAAALVGNGVTAAALAPKGSLKHGFDVSADGKQYVAVWSAGYCTQQGQKDYILSATTDGASATMLMGPITDGCGVDKLAISGDGTAVAYDVDDSDTSKHDVGVIGFAGGGKKAIATFPGGADTNWGLSDDGKLLVANYRLYNADGSGAFDLAIQGGYFSNDPPSGIDLYLGTPNGKVDRILYVNTGANPRRMTALEINPSSMGAAPTITNPSVTPASIPADGSLSATLTAKVESSGSKIVRVGAAVLQDGAHDDKGFNDVVLFDDGTHGDAVANDGIYSDNELRTTSGAKAGPRTIRVRATIIDTAGKSHSTVVELGPFAVQ